MNHHDTDTSTQVQAAPGKITGHGVVVKPEPFDAMQKELVDAEFRILLETLKIHVARMQAQIADIEAKLT